MILVCADGCKAVLIVDEKKFQIMKGERSSIPCPICNSMTNHEMRRVY